MGCVVGVAGVGDGIITTDVGEDGILVRVGVAVGNTVDVVVGVKIDVMVGQTPSGMEILPAALAHRL